MAESAFDEAVRKAQSGESVEVTPRQIVNWWGVSRRGRNVVAGIRRELKKNKLTTTPDFEAAYIDAPICLVSVTAAKTKGGKKDAEAEKAVEPATVEGVEPAHRISRLQAANREPVSVKPSDSLNLAVTIMLQNEYSQLPVMKNPGQVAGMISWRSIGKKLHISDGGKKVEDCIEKHQEVRDTASLFDVIQIVATHDCVLVRSSTNNKITGIVTNADISQEFKTLSEPFLMLGDIENALRQLIDRCFKRDELAGAVDPEEGSRPVESASDLTFGEYLRLMEKPENWDRFKLPLDRAEIVNKLERIRTIRNDVMHFDPDPLDSESQALLRSFAKFLSELIDLLD